MPKQTICIQNPSKISVKNCSLVISQNKKQARIPLEDIWVVILETSYAEITSAALSQLTEYGIGIMTCNTSHMPNGLCLPLAAHSRHAAIVEHQLTISKPLAKQLWQRVIEQKISNQSAVLTLCGLDASNVSRYVHQVHSGDTTNREAVAAAAYFKVLIPKGTRRESDWTAPMDYGYSVLRAGIARTAVSGGWLVSRGIFHSSNLNAFNLVDDFIEPFRPIIDLVIMQLGLKGELTSSNKAQLTRIFEYYMLIDDKRYTVQSSIEIVFGTLKSAVENNDASLLKLPSIIPLTAYISE
jgi:CRISPR-associated protein Cas1